MNPNTSHDQLHFAHKASIKALHALAGEAIDKAERLTALNLNVARTLTEDSAAHAHAIFEAGDLSEVIKLQADKLQPRMDRAAAFASGITDLAAETHREFIQITREWFEELNAGFSSALDRASTSAPAGSEAIFAAIKSATDVARNLNDSVSRTALETSKAVSSSVTDATDTALDTATATRPGKTARTTKAIASDEEN